MPKPNTGTAPQPRSNRSGMCPVRTGPYPTPPPFSPHPTENNNVRGKTPRSTPRNKGLTPSRVLASSPHRNAGEGEHGQAADRLAKATGRFKDAPQEQVFHLRAGRVVDGARDDAIVVDLAGTVDICLHHHRPGAFADL